MFILEQNKKPETQQEKPKFINTDNTIAACDWVNEFANTSNWITIIDSTYLNDDFNFHGLKKLVSNYDVLVKYLRGKSVDLPADTSLEALNHDLKILYINLHQRYLLTERGCRRVDPKYTAGVYGKCPRVECDNCDLLPIGFSHIPGVSQAKAFCPKCQEVYETKENVDGALFGPYFPQYFLCFNSSRRILTGCPKPDLKFMGMVYDGYKDNELEA